MGLEQREQELYDSGYHKVYESPTKWSGKFYIHSPGIQN